MGQPSEGMSLLEFLRRARKTGQRIDRQAIKRSDEAVKDHERRLHTGQREPIAASDAPPEEDATVEVAIGDPLTDAQIVAVIEQVWREGVSYPYACEYQGILWPRFAADFANYRKRYRGKVRRGERLP